MEGRELMQRVKRNDSYRPDPDRYENAEFRRAGRSGLKLSVVSLGLWHNFGSSDDYENMREMVFTAFDCGITVFDIANNYGPSSGSAERNFGSILARDLASYRDEMIITTKAGYGAWKGPYGGGDGSRKHLVSSLDRSLKNLGLEYVDIFYHHRPDPDTPLEETCLALKYIVDSGRALYVGISNYGCERTRDICAMLRELRVPFVLTQMPYSIFERKIEREGIKALAEEEGFAVTAYSPLAQGLLTDKYLCGIPAGSRMERDYFLKKAALTEEKLAQIKALNELAAQRGQTLAEMALSWAIRDGSVASVIIGASSPQQIRQNVKLNSSFTAEELKRIDTLSGN